MKVRVKIPEHIGLRVWHNNNVPAREFVDDILVWAMEIETDAEFYAFYHDPIRDKDRGVKIPDMWAIFIIEPDLAFMFALKWGAIMHKGSKRKNKGEEYA